MEENDSCIVYTLENCPNCEILKEELNRNNISYHEYDMASIENITELRMNGIFVREAPVLQSGTKFYTSKDLFFNGMVKEEIIKTFKG